MSLPPAANLLEFLSWSIEHIWSHREKWESTLDWFPKGGNSWAGWRQTRRICEVVCGSVIHSNQTEGSCSTLIICALYYICYSMLHSDIPCGLWRPVLFNFWLWSMDSHFELRHCLRELHAKPAGRWPLPGLTSNKASRRNEKSVLLEQNEDTAMLFRMSIQFLLIFLNH